MQGLLILGLDDLKTRPRQDSWILQNKQLTRFKKAGSPGFGVYFICFFIKLTSYGTDPVSLSSRVALLKNHMNDVICSFVLVLTTALKHQSLLMYKPGLWEYGLVAEHVGRWVTGA